MISSRESRSRRLIADSFLRPGRDSSYGPARPGSAPDELPERVAPLLEALELVVARARGAQQHDVARPSEPAGVEDRAFEGLVDVSVDERPEAVRLGADQVDRAHIRPDRRGERREVLALGRASE